MILKIAWLVSASESGSWRCATHSKHETAHHKHRQPIDINPDTKPWFRPDALARRCHVQQSDS